MWGTAKGGGVKKRALANAQSRPDACDEIQYPEQTGYDEAPECTWRGSTEWRGSIAGVRCLHFLGFNCLRRLYRSHGVGLSSAPTSAVTVLVGGGWAGPGRYSLSAAQNSEPAITSNVPLSLPPRGSLQAYG